MKKVLSLMFLVSVLTFVGCGGSSTPDSTTPDVTGTKDDPSIQAVRALFSTTASGASINTIDQAWPFLANIIGTGDSMFPCSTGTRSCTGFGTGYACVFTNCEFETSTLAPLLDATPSCMTKFTLDGSITTTTTNVVDNFTWDGTCTDTISISVEMNNGTTVAPISCALNVTLHAVNNHITLSGTICGVDINTVDSVCSL